MKHYSAKILLSLVLGMAAGVVHAEDAIEPSATDEEHGIYNPYRLSDVPVNAQQAQDMANKVRDSQVMQGGLDKSWAKVKVTETRQRTYHNETEWVVVYTNPAETNAAQKTLYIFLDLHGDVVDVNFTGN